MVWGGERGKAKVRKKFISFYGKEVRKKFIFTSGGVASLGWGMDLGFIASCINGNGRRRSAGSLSSLGGKGAYPPQD